MLSRCFWFAVCFGNDLVLKMRDTSGVVGFSESEEAESRVIFTCGGAEDEIRFNTACSANISTGISHLPEQFQCSYSAGTSAAGVDCRTTDSHG